MLIRAFSALLTALLACLSMAASPACTQDPRQAFDKLLGDWVIHDWARQPDGGWSPQAGGEWQFQCLERGIAIQDYYRSNDALTVGTNLRVYDPESEHWQVVWTATDSPGFSHYTAVYAEDQQRIVMQSVTGSEQMQRAIYKNIQADSWDWELQHSADGEQPWVPVYRIHAVRKNSPR